MCHRPIAVRVQSLTLLAPGFLGSRGPFCKKIRHRPAPAQPTAAVAVRLSLSRDGGARRTLGGSSSGMEYVVQPESQRAHGRCLCGKVRFSVELPTLWCAHCHCGWCRQAHGAAYVTWFGVPAERCRYDSGQDRVRTYQSSPPSRRSFCGSCGTTFLFESSTWPGETHIALATMTDAIDREPQRHVFTEHRVSWATVPPLDQPG